MEKNLAIIGASYLQLPLIEKAKEMGYTTHVFAWKANDVGEEAADKFYPISIIEKKKYLKYVKDRYLWNLQYSIRCCSNNRQLCG